MTEQAADDRALLERHVAGDTTAFALLVERHRDRLWRIALRTLGDADDAADAVQDALLSAFRGAGGFRGDAAVTTWLHRVVVNACLDRLRRRAVRPTAPLGDIEVPTVRDEHGALETRLDVQAALARLPEAQRLAVVLVDLQDLSVAEAAAFLGVAEGTVKSRCSRGRLALARLLRGDHPEIEDGAGGNLPGVPRVAPADRSGAGRGPGGGRTRSSGEEGERGHAWTAS
jgi:RNA polymerase sigma-70 factor (ECF subfamily)